MIEITYQTHAYLPRLWNFRTLESDMNWSSTLDWTRISGFGAIVGLSGQ